MTDNIQFYNPDNYENEYNQYFEVFSKIILIVLYTQLGKTFISIQRIKNNINNDKKLGKSIHIVYAMNTILANKQFSKRLDSIYDEELGKNTVVVFSSEKKVKHGWKQVNTREQLMGICFVKSTCPKVIIMCSNKIRYEDGYQFIKDICEHEHKIFERIFLIYDELHAYITPELRRNIENISRFSNVKEIIGMTATPEAIWSDKKYIHEDFWKNIKLYEIEDKNFENYVGSKDIKFIPVDDYFDIDRYIRPNPIKEMDKLDNDTCNFIEHVLNNHEEILVNNNRIFIPGHKRRICHERICISVMNKNDKSVIIIINGINKEFRWINNKKEIVIKKIDITEKKELSEIISEKIIEYNLNNRPLVITGLLCVGMGQTLVSKNIGPFTHAIFSHLDLSNAEIYQLFGRITGRMKDWETYVCTIMFCPTATYDRIQLVEEYNRNIIENHNGEKISVIDYKEPLKKSSNNKNIINNIRIESTSKSRAESKSRIKNTRVPYCIENIDNNSPILKEKTNKKTKFNNLINIIKNNDSIRNNNLINFIDSVYKYNKDHAKFIRPKSESTKKTHIENVLKNYNNNTPFIISYNYKHKNNDGFICIIDYEKHRLFICVNVVNKNL